MISYLSLNRKKPTDDTTMLNTAIIPNQLVCLIPVTATEGSKPYLLINGESKLNSFVANKVINKTTNEPTPTMTNIFCLSFILKFNTFLLIGSCNTTTIGVTYANE